MEQTLLVSQIERCAVHDGPGIRTVVFFQGCPLHCFWCCNPETQPFTPVRMYDRTKCVLCTACINACGKQSLSLQNGTIRQSPGCDACRQCAEVCPAGAVTFSSLPLTAEQILDVVMRDAPFYEETGGGLTVSGGEPFAQREILPFLRQAKDRGLNIYAETTAQVSIQILRESLNFVDGYYIDYKHPEESRLREATGADLQIIEENIRTMKTLGADITLRTPVIPGFNDDPEILKKCFAFANSAGIENYVLLPYHSLGRKKYRMLEKPYMADDLRVLTADDLKDALALGQDCGLRMRTQG